MVTRPSIEHVEQDVEGWCFTVASGTAQALHDRPLDPDPVPTVWLNNITRPALVLGSTQAATVVDEQRASDDGVEVCRRRSGGGLVVLRPGLDTWIDVVVPSHSALWSTDVTHAFDWLGATWATVVASLMAADSTFRPRPLAGEGPAPSPTVEVHRGALQGGAAGKLVCFASLGAGEVTVDGAKVVGISQRRTRNAARFQCVLTWHWYPDFLRTYLDRDELCSAAIDLDALAAGTSSSAEPEPGMVARSFLDHLPSPN